MKKFLIDYAIKDEAEYTSYIRERIESIAIRFEDKHK